MNIDIDETIRQQLAQFPERGRPLLSQFVTTPEFIGRLSAEQVDQLATKMQLSVHALMHALVPLARSYAFPPISNYIVGTIVLGASGAFYFGGNLEFPGMGLNMTVHGEQAAVVNARQHGERRLDALAVNGTPCGHCRQFLAEMNNPDLVVIYWDGQARPLEQVLPDAFSPMALGNERGLLNTSDLAPDLPQTHADTLTSIALQAAAQSYAPYSKNLAGVALQLTDGTIAAGSYLENAAFNPTLSPLQTALVRLRLRRLSWHAIERAVLVERERALNSLAPMCRALLNTLGNAELSHIKV